MSSFVFRVDASIDIGSGHVVRCLTLADALVRSGHDVRFICRRHEGHLGDLIEQHGFRVTLMEPYHDFTSNELLAHADWLGTSWFDDAQDVSALLMTERPDWLIVDHYGLDKDWQHEIRPHCDHIMVIDDLADRRHDADVILDQNFYPGMEERYDDLVSDDAVKLIGPRYAMLREEFTALHDAVQVRSDAREVLVFFGGVDKHDLTSTALDALEQLDTELKLTVITGNHNSRADEIIARCEDLPHATAHRHVDNIAELMMRADLAIGAGGTTTWERCYLGLPAVVVTLADNQAAVNDAVSSAGACILAGRTDIGSDSIASALESLLTDNELNRASQAALEIMQGHLGTAGVVAALETYHD